MLVARSKLILLLALGVFILATLPAQGMTVLGTGSGALLGGDLTDPENDGHADADVNYNATFTGNDEAAFGGGEHAFNIFDSRVGGGNDKWCCGPDGGIPAEGLWVTAQLDAGRHKLTHFTLSSANDTPGRDPTDWAIQGSNDGVNFTDIFTHAGSGVWTDRNQVIRFDAGVDYVLPQSGYEYLRFVTYDTALNPSGAYFQIAEVEYFGDYVPEPSTLVLGAFGLMGLAARRRRKAR